MLESRMRIDISEHRNYLYYEAQEIRTSGMLTSYSNTAVQR